MKWARNPIEGWDSSSRTPAAVRNRTRHMPCGLQVYNRWPAVKANYNIIIAAISRPVWGVRRRKVTKITACARGISRVFVKIKQFRRNYVHRGVVSFCFIFILLVRYRFLTVQLIIRVLSYMCTRGTRRSAARIRAVIGVYIRIYAQHRSILFSPTLIPFPPANYPAAWTAVTESSKRIYVIIILASFLSRIIYMYKHVWHCSSYMGTYTYE